MRAFPIFAILFVAASASAQRAPAPVAPRAPAPRAPTLTLMAIDASNVPDACKPLADRAASTNAGMAQESRVALALCIAQERTKPIVVCDCEQSLKDLDDAAAPAFELLADLAAHGELPWQLVALHTDGKLLEQLAQRVVDAIPALPPNASEDQTSLHALREQMIEPLVRPAFDQARARFAEVDRRAQAHPQLAQNALVRDAIADSRKQLATREATR